MTHPRGNRVTHLVNSGIEGLASYWPGLLQGSFCDVMGAKKKQTVESLGMRLDHFQAVEERERSVYSDLLAGRLQSLLHRMRRGVV